MTTPDFSRAIIEELYSEALVLADEARTVFDLRARETDGPDRDNVRIALSIEGLKTTTRVMHLLAWLLNRRAYLAGELTERQLRDAGGLPDDRPADPAQMAQLLPATRALIRDTERLYARAARLDAGHEEAGNSPVERMHGRLTQVFATG
ncbi:DUF1465 family protein [Qipengyuania sp. MTN3-11]|uniref:DUF1465 family protein n=1 Tax=Qipengyuania sp. MTN3-11 TaxID=3056557 RepID=UPI0036F34D89